MISAEKASIKTSVEKVLQRVRADNYVDKVLRKINREIKQSIKEGRYYCCYYYNNVPINVDRRLLKELIMIELEKKGYSVEYSERYYRFDIEWRAKENV